MLRPLTILVVFSMLIHFNVARADITTGLIARYTFDGNANDVSGNGNHGTPVGGLTLTTDRFGASNCAYSFNGTDSYILVPDSPSLNSPSTACSQAAWVLMYGVSLVGDHYNPLIMKSNDTPNSFMYRMIANPDYLGMAVNTWFTSQAIGQAIPLNEWHHVASVFDGSTVRFYYDGAFIGSAFMGYTIATDSRALTIGADTPGVLEIFNGKIDDVCIYNRALTDADVLELMNQRTVSAVSIARPGLWVGSPIPNPASGAIRVEYDLPASESVDIAVYDVAGHRVRVLESGAHGSGAHTTSWDGREENGSVAPSGLYFLRLKVESHVVSARVVRIL